MAVILRMKYTIFILAILLNINLFSQNRLLTSDLDFDFNQSIIQNSESRIHIRFIKDCQIVDLQSNNGKDFTGTLINKLIELKKVKTDYGKDLDSNKYVYEILQLDDKSVSEIGTFLLSEKVFEIPTDTLIKEWNFNWLDCGSISFNFKIDNSFNSTEYTCPWNQNDSVIYVKKIKNSYDSIMAILDLKSKFSDFKNKLEKGKYYSNGFWTTYIMTDKQSKRWEDSKPQRDYLYSIKDTITNFLKIRLNEIIKNPEDLDCFDEYYLTFTKKGELKKVSIANTDFDRESKIEFKKCKHFIQTAFEEIEIDFVDPKYEFTRKIGFLNDKINVYDPTRY